MGFLSSILRKSNYENINGSDVDQLINNNKDLRILDVRTNQEYKMGHILNAKNIPVDELKSKLNTLKINKETPILVYCASGGRSARAAKLLSDEGYEKIYNLSGGVSSYKGKLV